MVRVLLITAVVSLAVEAAAQVPNTFSAGSPAKAAEVNANFSYLDGRVTALASEFANGVTVSNTPASPVPVDVQNVVTVAVASVVKPSALVPVSVNFASNSSSRMYARVSLPSPAVVEWVAATCPTWAARAEQIAISALGTPTLPPGVSAVNAGYSGTLTTAPMRLTWPSTSMNSGAAVPPTKVEIPVESTFELWVGPAAEGCYSLDCTVTLLLRYVQ
jgi:hypothetical protein